MTLIKTKEKTYYAYGSYFISTPLHNKFELRVDLFTDEQIGIFKLEIAYDTAQDNSK